MNEQQQLSGEEMERELVSAGWERKMIRIWRAPNGSLHLGPHGAWRKMRNAMSTQDHVDRSNGRERLNARAMKIRLDIEQIFIDCASWNDNSKARQEGCDPIDADPDGQMRRLADGLDRTIVAEAERQAH